ncbi:MAG: hypothetical protein AAB221_05860 [Bacteroidota bacterium]|nr:MAG: hypothetical protein A2W28_00325 [Gammaproteobacteria bacterium RBG_16_51_14]
MNFLTIVIIAALIVTVAIAAMGIFSMSQGDKFDTQMKLARVGTDTMTFWLLILALYLIYKNT